MRSIKVLKSKIVTIFLRTYYINKISSPLLDDSEIARDFFFFVSLINICLRYKTRMER